MPLVFVLLLLGSVSAQTQNQKDIEAIMNINIAYLSKVRHEYADDPRHHSAPQFTTGQLVIWMILWALRLLVPYLIYFAVWLKECEIDWHAVSTADDELGNT